VLFGSRVTDSHAKVYRFVLDHLMPGGYPNVVIMPYTISLRDGFQKAQKEDSKHKTSPGILFILYIT
jgi:hypothetical protein